MAKWLSDEEQAAWRNYLEATRQLDCAMDQRLQNRSDLTLTDYVILVSLSEAEGRRLRMSELASIAVVSRSRMTYRIDSLVKRGYIGREQCDDDRRGLFANLTDLGFDVLSGAAPEHVDDVREMLFDNIKPDEFRAFASIVDRMANNIRDCS